MSNSSPEEKLWFQLVDENGDSYKNASADYVSREPGLFIAQFRKAVKAEHSNKLATVDAADLIVYANKAAFEARNYSMIQAQMRSSATLDDLGKTEDKALVVVVPRGNFINLYYFNS